MAGAPCPSGSAFPFTKEQLIKHSIALVTGAASGLGHAAVRLLAAEGYREVIVTGRGLVRIQEAAAQLAAESKRQVSTPLELVKRGRRVDSLLLNAGMAKVTSACSLRRASRRLQALLSGHHQLTAGSLYSPSN